MIRLRNRKYVAVLGGNGSGKGTLCKELHHEDKFLHLEMSHVIKLRRERDSVFDKLADEYVASQRLVPCHLLKDTLSDYLTHIPIARRMLFDGWPRTYQQAVYNSDILAEREADGEKNIGVIYLTASEETAVINCTKRYEHDLRTKGRGREDDRTPDNIKKRYNIFKKEIDPIVDYFKARGLPVVEIKVDDRSPDSVTHEAHDLLLG